MSERKFEINLDFTTNRQSLEKAIRELTKSTEIIESQGLKLGFSEDSIIKTKQQVEFLANSIKKNFNEATGSVNFDAVRRELFEAGTSVKELQARFNKLGIGAKKSFQQIDDGLVSVKTTIKSQKSLIDGFSTTLYNSAKWSAATFITGQMANAFNKMVYFTKDLDRNLNAIRVVTGQSAGDMEEFAKQANNAARALSTTTNEYAEASLVFFQQGLPQESVRQMTEATIMAARISGENAEDMSNYLTTAVNGYGIAAEKVLEVTDKLSSVGAGTAADFGELAIGMSKVASMANVAGVSMDELLAQIATIVSVTKEAPESVGTSLKTIYGRMLAFKNDVDAQFTDENGEYFSAPAVEKALQKMSLVTGKTISLFEEVGGKRVLRDIGTVVRDIGDNWEYVEDKAVKAGIATALAGSRQQNRLLSLLDNWNLFKESLEMSNTSEGTTLSQYAISLDSIDAKTDKVTASFEKMYAAIFSAETYKHGLDITAWIVDLVANVTRATGGLSSLLGMGSGILARGIFKQRYSPEKILLRDDTKRAASQMFNDPSVDREKLLSEQRKLSETTQELSRHFSQETIKSLDDQANAYLQLAHDTQIARKEVEEYAKATDNFVKNNFSKEYEKIGSRIAVGPHRESFNSFFDANKESTAKIGSKGTTGLTEGIRKYISLINDEAMSQAASSGSSALEESVKEHLVKVNKDLFEYTNEAGDRVKRTIKEAYEIVEDYKKDIIASFDDPDQQVKEAERKETEAKDAFMERVEEMRAATEESERLYLQTEAVTSLALPTLISAFKTDESYISNFTESLSSLSFVMVDVVRNSMISAKSVTGLGAKIGVFTKGIATSIMTMGPYVAAIAAIGFAVWGIAKAIDNANLTLKEQQEIVAEVGSEVEELKTKYLGLRDAVSAKLDADQHYEITTAEKELYDIYEDQYKMKDLQLKKEMAILAALKEKKRLEGDGDASIDPVVARDNYLKKREAKTETSAAQNEIAYYASMGVDANSIAYYKSEFGAPKNADFSTGEKTVEELFDAIEEFNALREKVINDSILAEGNAFLEKAANADKEALDSWGEFILEDVEKEIDKIESIMRYSGGLDPINSSNLDFLYAYRDILSGTADVTEDLTTAMTEEELAFSKVSSDLSELIGKYGSLKDELESLHGALYEYNKEGEISSETILDMVEAYPELLLVMEDQARLADEISKKYNITTDALEESLKAKIKMDANYYTELLKNNSKYTNILLERYGIDLKNYKTIAEAKLALDAALMKSGEPFYEVTTGLDRIGSLEQRAREKARNILDVDVDAIINSLKQSFTDTLDAKRNTGSTKDFLSNYKAISAETIALTKELEKLKRAYEDLEETDFSGQVTNFKSQNDVVKKLVKSLTTDIKKVFDANNLKSLTKIDLSELFTLDGNGSILEEGAKDKVQAFYAAIDAEMLRLSKINTEAAKKQFEALEEAIDLIGTASKEAIDYQVELGATIKEIQSKIDEQIESTKEFLKASTQAALANEEKRLENIENLIEKTKELIKFEKEQLKEIIEEKKEKLKLDKEELDFAKKLRGEQEDVAKLQAKYELLLRDNSQAGIARRLEVEEELKTARETLQETEADRALEIKTEQLDEEIKLIDDYLSESGTLTEDAMQRIEADFISGMGVLKSELITWNATYGTGIDEDIVSAWDSATLAFEKYEKVIKGSGLLGATNTIKDNIKGYENSLSQGEEDITSPKAIVAKMKENGVMWHSGTAAQRKELSDINEGLAKQLQNMYPELFKGLSKDASGVWRLKDGSSLYSKYQDGGVSTKTQTAILHGTLNDPEWIFNNRQLKETIASIVAEAKGMPSRLGTGISSMNSTQSSAVGEINIDFSNMINIEGSADQETVKQLKGVTEDIVEAVVKKITQSFSLKGQYKIRSI